jgi:hypothetical protein
LIFSRILKYFSKKSYVKYLGIERIVANSAISSIFAFFRIIFVGFREEKFSTVVAAAINVSLGAEQRCGKENGGALQPTSRER